jgi:hypothetical protein
MPTEVIPKNLYEKRNTDDIFTRNVIGGLLKVLNNTLTYDQIWDDEKGYAERITIPFYYELGNPLGERFLQDNYLFFGDQCGFKKINGNFDMVPRGIISLNSSTIQADQITNRMVYGEYQKEDPKDGKIKTYVAFLYSLPITMSVTATIYASTFNETLKIDQACKEFFYKNKTFYITYRGMKLGCRVGFPESFLGEKMSGFTMGTDSDKQYQKIEFELTIECYQPVFDYTTERLNSNVMRSVMASVTNIGNVEEMKASHGFSGDLETTLHDDLTNEPYHYTPDFRLNHQKVRNDENNKIYVIDHFGNHPLYPSGSVMKLRWGWRKETGDLNRVAIKWQDQTIENIEDDAFMKMSGEANLIDVVTNHQFYDWDIPRDFTGFKGIDIALMNDNQVSVYKDAIIKAIPDPSTGNITQDTVFCLDPGYFTCTCKEEEWDKKEWNGKYLDYYTHIDGEISYEDKSGNIQSVAIRLPVKNNRIQTREDDPNLIAFDSEFSIKYDNDFSPKTISVILQDPTNPGLYCRIPNITII